MPDVVRDFLGLSDWNSYCAKFFAEARDEDENVFKAEYFTNAEVYNFYSEKIIFDYEKIIELANASGILKNSLWEKYFRHPEDYNRNINHSLTYLLTLQTNKEEKQQIVANITDYLNKPPTQFLSELAKHLYHRETFTDFNEKRSIIGKMIKQAIIDCYKHVTKKFYPREQRLPGYEITNFCMLGTIITLRNNSKLKLGYDRLLYNIHQLTVNIERKLFLEDHFYKMSKFKVIKLVGVSLGMQISNIVEWCLPPSYFTSKYASDLEAAVNEKKKKDIRVTRCGLFAVNYGGFDNILGDLAGYDGTYQTYQMLAPKILKIDDWESTNLLLYITENYLGDPQGEDVQAIEYLKQDYPVFNKCTTDHNKIYLSREITSLIYEEDEYDEPGLTEEQKDDVSNINDQKRPELAGNHPNDVSNIQAQDQIKSKNTSQISAIPSSGKGLIGLQPFGSNNLGQNAISAFQNVGKAVIDVKDIYVKPVGQKAVSVLKDVRQQAVLLQNKAISQGVSIMKNVGKKIKGIPVIKTMDEKREQIRNRKQTKENAENQKIAALKENTIDIKSGLVYNTLERKSEDFERALIDANTELFQGIISGDPSILLKGDHVIIRSDPQKKKAKIYMALIGLQSFRRRDNKDRKLLKEYLGAIAHKLDSDVSKVEELLAFLITGKPVLNDIVNTLEVNEQILDLLFMCMKSKTGVNQDEDDENEETNKFSVIQAIHKTLNISLSDLEAFDIVRNIYQFKRNAGWIRLVQKLAKASEGHVTKKLEDHPLVKLIKTLNFGKMRKEVSGSLVRHEVLNFIRAGAKYKEDALNMIFDEIVLGLVPLSSIKVDRDLLIKTHQVIQSIMKLDFPQLFHMLVLTNGETFEPEKRGEKRGLETKEQPNLVPQTEKLQEPFLERVLTVLGVNPKNSGVQKSIRLIKIFLTLTNGDLSSFKSKPNYTTTINSIIEDIIQSDLFDFMSKNTEIQRKFCQLLLGGLAWDIELIIKAFITEETLEEAYLLYHLYGCLRLNRVLSLGPKYSNQAQTHLKVILSVILKNLTSKSAAEMVLGGNKGSFTNLMATEFSGVDRGELPRLLEGKIEELLKITHLNMAKPPVSLFQHLAQAFDSIPPTQLSDFENYETFVGIITSVCDGSILIKIIDTFISDDKLKTFLIDLIRFMLKLIEKFFTPAGKKIGSESILEQFETSASSLRGLANNEVFDKVLLITPDVMKMYLVFESESNVNTVQIKIDVLVIIKRLMNSMGSSEKIGMIYDLMSVVLGLNMRTFNEQNPGNKLKFDLGPSDRMDLFFTKILPDIFPGLDKYLDGADFVKIYELVMKLRTDFMQNFKDPQRLREIVKDLLHILDDFGAVDQPLVQSLISLLEGDIEGCNYLVHLLIPDTSPDSAQKMLMYINEARDVLNFNFINKRALPSSGRKAQSNGKIDSENWTLILKKIKEGTASSKDLFDVIDEAGDKSGTISESEFQMLASRLGLKLSQHRIKEIFSKVKGNKSKGVSDQELNEREFEKALEYLESKNLQQALLLLGITPEILTAIFIKLVILLILIFIFIFLGIKAFAIGGTFGAIINSFFPAAGGFGLGKEKQADKDKLDDKNVEKVSETGFEITTSEQL